MVSKSNVDHMDYARYLNFLTLHDFVKNENNTALKLAVIVKLYHIVLVRFSREGRRDERGWGRE